jgi:hypothetical protein
MCDCGHNCHPFSADHNRDSSCAEFLRGFNVLCAFKDSMATWMWSASKIDALNSRIAGTNATP